MTNNAFYKENCDGTEQGVRSRRHAGPADEHAPGGPHDLTVTARVLPGGSPTKFKIADNAPLLQLLEDGARHLGIQLLPPPPLRPLDRLHDIVKHDEVGPVIGDLDQSVGEYSKGKGTTKDFGIELVLAFRVNTHGPSRRAP